MRCKFMFFNTVGCVEDSAGTSASHKLQSQGVFKGAAKYAKRTEFAAPPKRSAASVLFLVLAIALAMENCKPKDLQKKLCFY